MAHSPTNNQPRLFPNEKAIPLWEKIAPFFAQADIELTASIAYYQANKKPELTASLQHYAEHWLNIAYQLHFAGHYQQLIEIICLLIEVMTRAFNDLADFDQQQILLMHWQKTFATYWQADAPLYLAESLIHCLRDPVWGEIALTAADEAMLLANLEQNPQVTLEKQVVELTTHFNERPVLNSTIPLSNKEAIWPEIEPVFAQAAINLQTVFDDQQAEDGSAFHFDLQCYIENWQEIADILNRDDASCGLAQVVLLFVDMGIQAFVQQTELSAEQATMLKQWQTYFADYLTHYTRCSAVSLIQCLSHPVWNDHAITPDDEQLLLEGLPIAEEPVAPIFPEAASISPVFHLDEAVIATLATLFAETQVQLQTLLTLQAMANAPACRERLQGYAETWTVIANTIAAQDSHGLPILAEVSSLLADNCHAWAQAVNLTEAHGLLLAQWQTAFAACLHEAELLPLLICLEQPLWLQPLTAVDRQFLLTVAQEQAQEPTSANALADAEHLLMFNGGLFSEARTVEPTHIAPSPALALTAPVELPRLAHLPVNAADLPTDDVALAKPVVIPVEKPVEATTKVAEPIPMLRVPCELVDNLLHMTSEAGVLHEQLKDKVGQFAEELNNLNSLSWSIQSLISELNQCVTLQNYAVQATIPSAFDALEPSNELHTAANRIAEVASDIRETTLNMEEQLMGLRSLMREENALQKENHAQLQSIRMVPAGTIVSRCQRIVRQAGRAAHKKVELEVKGASLRIDSEILNAMLAPLKHLLRNSVDHGIESPAQRKKLNKNKVGTITLEFKRHGNFAMIRCQDDGSGLVRDAILQTAVQKGLIAADQALTEAEIHQLILRPGFSGGLGMNAIQSKISTLQGQMRLFSVTGVGLTIDITIPLTLSSVLSLLVTCQGQTMAISNRGLRKIYHADDCVLFRADNQLWCDIEYERYPANYLAALLGMPVAIDQKEKLPAVQIEDDSGQMYLVFVDELLGYRDLSVKNLGHYIQSIQGVSGAAILGNGDIAPVIDLVDMLHPVRKYTGLLAA